ncbi:MAG TPA: hypothetical protein VKU77_25915 [Streptosporangiaceae bacterium]|nr:hypothetical protein [Streptosporangiaceae bacterium]
MDQADRHGPGPAQVQQHLVAVAGGQPEPVLEYGEHRGVRAVPPSGSGAQGVEGVEGLEDGALDQPEAAALAHPAHSSCCALYYVLYLVLYRSCTGGG